MTTYSNDGSGNHTTAPSSADNAPSSADNHRHSPSLAPVSETDNLLGKKGEESTQEMSSDEEGDETTGFLGTIVEGYEYIVDGYENFAGNAADFAQDVGQAIADEAKDYREAFLDGLHDKNEGESVIYEMGMTRNLSLLPSDMEIFADDMTLPEEYAACTIFPAPKRGHRRVVSQTHTFIDEEGQQQEVIIEKTVYTGSIPFHAYFTLLIAVIALSSIGPSLEMQANVVPSMKIFWRMTATYIVLSPLALSSIYKDGFPKLTYTQTCTFAMATFSYAFFCVTFVIALEYTSVGNVVIFSNRYVKKGPPDHLGFELGLILFFNQI